MVVKPSEGTPQTAAFLDVVMNEAGVPQVRVQGMGSISLRFV